MTEAEARDLVPPMNGAVLYSTRETYAVGQVLPIGLVHGIVRAAGARPVTADDVRAGLACPEAVGQSLHWACFESCHPDGSTDGPRDCSGRLLLSRGEEVQAA